jgi:hypothetical protein
MRPLQHIVIASSIILMNATAASRTTPACAASRVAILGGHVDGHVRNDTT